MKKYIIWKAVFVLIGISFTLLSILALHVYQVTQASDNSHKQVQLSRIDFDCSLTDQMVKKVKKKLRSQKGVRHVYCNAQDGIAVFSHSPLFTHYEHIIANLKQEGFDRVHRYVPDLNTRSGGCPMVREESWLLQWGEKIHHLFSYT